MKLYTLALLVFGMFNRVILKLAKDNDDAVAPQQQMYCKFSYLAESVVH